VTKSSRTGASRGVATDENVAVVLGIFRAVQERDREALLALYHDEIEFHDAESLPYGGVFRGKRQARERLASHAGE
jgi:uncharacterized protein